MSGHEWAPQASDLTVPPALASGELEVLGELPDSSNAALLVRCHAGEVVSTARATMACTVATSPLFAMAAASIDTASASPTATFGWSTRLSTSASCPFRPLIVTSIRIGSLPYFVSSAADGSARAASGSSPIEAAS